MRIAKESLCLVFFITFIAVFSLKAFAQITIRSHKINREINFSYENDNFFGTDQYYTSGAQLSYSRHVKLSSKFYRRFSSKKTDSSKLIVRYTYGHQMMTPSDIRIRPEKISKADRPYAGWHYATFSIDNYPSSKVKNSYQITVGLIGEESGIGNFHEWWHKSLGIKHPKGWDTEINNEAIVNLHYNRLQAFKIYKSVNVVTNSHLLFGNGANKIGQSAIFRLGKSNPLNNSSFANSRLSSLIPQIRNTDSQEEEGFVFYGWDTNYVLSDVFIEGSLLNDNSPYVKDAESFVYTRKYGFMYSNYYTSFSVIVYKISKEVIGGKAHRYISIQLALRY